jgi:arylsulfatase A-like enzyme
VPPDGKDGHGQATGVPWYALLRQGDFKYIRTLVPGETEELYDLRRDPEELHNLARDPTHAVRLRELRQTALAELRRTEAPFVDVLPPVAGE